MKPLRPALPVKPRNPFEISLRRLPAQFIRQRRHILFRQQRRFLRRNPAAQQQRHGQSNAHSFHRFSLCARILFRIRAFAAPF